MNPIRAIQELGQSLWYDNIRRGLIDSGELAQLISQGITGVTSNPTIFEKAIDGSKDYDSAIAALARQRLFVDAIYDALVLEDIGRGADLLRPVYDRTHGHDGYISIEVPPTMAEDTNATIHEAHRLFSALNRPNIMIKVPATPAGIPAIRRLIGDGINVNVTLIFSLEAYADVIQAYVSGLEDRMSKGLPIDRVASVASFFISRVDTLIDRLIEERQLDVRLQGKAAIANAKLAYRLFQKSFGNNRFDRLKKAGAMAQRPLWASTSTKNPAYPDLLYVEALIGPDTVDTLPPATVNAILNHGRAERTIDQDVEEAQAFLESLESQGISMKAVTEQLLQEGVKSFHQSFATLRESLKKKSAHHAPARDAFDLGLWQTPYSEMLEQLRQDRSVPRLFEHDTTLWTSDPAHRAIIENALGWLSVPERVLDDLSRITKFFEQALLDGFTDAVVLGMGGSSLVSDVLVSTFKVGRPGLRLHVLDTTNASAIQSLQHQLPLATTLFIVASKSGSTTEPNAFYHYFWHALEQLDRDPAPQFIAITDPGTAMAQEAERQHFRQIFLNPADIGGRYSALSWFGMVPATLYGLNVATLLAEALAMRQTCQVPDAKDNPGARLGTALGVLAQRGRDKITFVMPGALSHLADWLEQLLAESTGKMGTGLIPVAHEPLYSADSYSQDRVFVVYQWRDQPPALTAEQLTAHGHPVLRFQVDDPYQVAAEFYRWEIATAISGALLHIDAFDQPNVQESKENTKNILAQLDKGHLPTEELLQEQGFRWTASPQIKGLSLKDTLDALFQQKNSQSYIALMAYLEPNPEHDRLLAKFRKRLTAITGQAATLGYGPRFLHSTGQLHKGGPNTGLFLQLVAGSGPRLIVPGAGYDFMTLMQAQSLGDFQSLVHHGRSVVRVVLPASPSTALEKLLEQI